MAAHSWHDCQRFIPFPKLIKVMPGVFFLQVQSRFTPKNPNIELKRQNAGF